jgi:hypothetical protein
VKVANGRRSVHVQELDACFVQAGPANFTVKPEFAAFNFDGDFLALLQVFGVYGYPATADGDVLHNARAMGILKFQNALPLAPLAREGPHIFK